MAPFFYRFKSNHNTALLGLEGQFVAEIGMCDRNQLLCAAGERLPAQMRDAVFSDNVIHIILARGHDRAGGQDALNLADRAALGGGREGNEALAALGLAGTANIVHLSA